MLLVLLLLTLVYVYELLHELPPVYTFSNYNVAYHNSPLKRELEYYV